MTIQELIDKVKKETDKTGTLGKVEVEMSCDNLLWSNVEGYDRFDVKEVSVDEWGDLIIEIE